MDIRTSPVLTTRVDPQKMADALSRAHPCEIITPRELDKAKTASDKILSDVVSSVER